MDFAKIRGYALTGLAAAGTELALHGVGPRGILGATMGAMNAFSMVPLFLDQDVDLSKDKCGSKEVQYSLVMLTVSALANAVAMGALKLAIAYLSVTNCLGMAAGGAMIAYYFTDNSGDILPHFLEVSGKTIGCIGVELAAMVYMKTVGVAAAVSVASLGFAGVGAGFAMALAHGMYTQNSAVKA